MEVYLLILNNCTYVSVKKMQIYDQIYELKLSLWKKY